MATGLLYYSVEQQKAGAFVLKRKPLDLRDPGHFIVLERRCRNMQVLTINYYLDLVTFMGYSFLMHSVLYVLVVTTLWLLSKMRMAFREGN